MKSRPVLSIFLALFIFSAGAVIARQTTEIPPPTTSIPASKSNKVLSKNIPPKPSIEVSKAALHKNRLEQTLDNGQRVVLTLDPDLQKWASSFLQSYDVPYGAVVLLDIRRSKVLVMAGFSTASKEMTPEQLCLNTWAPAASVFKLITATALLASGVPASKRVCYHGGLHGLEDDNLIDNPARDTICHTLAEGIAKSLNPVLGKLALRHLNLKAMQRWSKRFGFFQPLPFDLPVQASRADFPAPPLELAKVAAGFWHTEISALHGAMIAAIIGTGGKLKPPTLVEKRVNAQGTTIHSKPKPRARQVIPKNIAARLSKIMVATTEKGTARKGFFSKRGKPFLPGIAVAGKTGSLTRNPPFIHYNWFVGFAPADRPQVAFAVLLGNPMEWRIKAHTVARFLLDKYFKTQKQKVRQQRGPLESRRSPQRSPRAQPVRKK